jgi:hypothetical protein
MAFHMEAFRSSLASGATDVFQQVTFITAGAVLAPAASGMQVSAFLSKIHSLFGVGAHLENIRTQANSFQPAPYPTFAPNNIGTALESPARVWDLSAFPKAMRPTEEFDIFASQTSGGAEVQAVFVNFTDGIINPAPPVSMQSSLNAVGQFFIAHGTGTTTLSANAWSQVTVTLDTPLPAGTYSLLGMRAMSAHALAFRVKPINEPVWRPGGAGVQTADQLDPVNQRFLNPVTGRISPWGVWLNFYQNTVPYIDMWATAADTVEDFFFDLVKTSDVVTAPAL